MRALVTGSSGYIGGRLVPRLLTAGHEVTCMTRDKDRLRDSPWVDKVQVVQADALDADSLPAAMAGVDVVYYLIHSIDTGGGYSARDRTAAENVAAAARDAGVRRLVYLGGLVPQGQRPSTHLASRAQVGDVLLGSGVPTAVLQAGVIIGSGSASFEMLRYLTERLPAMVAPRWVENRIQPVAVGDVLHYLVAAAGLPADVNRRFDIGGPDVMTYREMMQRYAAIAGLRRRAIVGVPVLSPWLAAHWVNLVTPVPRAIARPLVQSLINEVVCTEQDLRALVPDPPGGPTSFDQAVRLALRRIRDGEVATHWSQAAWPYAPSDPIPTDPEWAGGTLYVDERRTSVAAPPESVWAVVEGIGGGNGWYSWRLPWGFRGVVDRLVGGAGHNRGRRNPDTLRTGEAVDWWRVEHLDPGRLLLLRAEMKVPGRAWLEFTVCPEPGTGGRSGATLAQRAVFYPAGLPGIVYWFAVTPFHGIIFGGMQRNMAAAAVERAARR